MKQKQKQSAPRNHVVLAMIKRDGGSGVHEKSQRTQRRQDKIGLKQQMKRGIWQMKANYSKFSFTC